MLHKVTCLCYKDLATHLYLSLFDHPFGTVVSVSVTGPVGCEFIAPTVPKFALTLII